MESLQKELIAVKQCYKTGEFAELIGVSVSTLQKWDRDGTLRANRNPSGRRFYTKSHYRQYCGLPKSSVPVRKVGAKKTGPKTRRPDADTLRELYHTHTAGALGEMYGVSESTVRVWLWEDKKACVK